VHEAAKKKGTFFFTRMDSILDTLSLPSPRDVKLQRLEPRVATFNRTTGV
jgi:hypothetical protein